MDDNQNFPWKRAREGAQAPIVMIEVLVLDVSTLGTRKGVTHLQQWECRREAIAQHE
jgi:hypothetical protein